MIRLDQLTKTFDTPQGAVVAVDGISLEVPKGEICVLLGPSGCGKTTTLRMINRLVAPTSGKVYVDDRDTDTVDPIELRRSIGYVIQQVGLFPNKTVRDNICIVPDLLGWDRKKSRARAVELLELVGMKPGEFLDRYPRELSGGQQQRVGVLRALAADPPVMLMDEPFGAIDPINREVIQNEFLRMQQSIRKTIVFVSHDLDEAMRMANRIAIFQDGKLEQCATPAQLLATPANEFVQSFLGSDTALKRLRLITVAQAMRTSPLAVAIHEPLDKALAVSRESGLDSVFVVDEHGRLLGVLDTRDNIGCSGRAMEYAKSVRATVTTTSDLRSAVALMFTHDISVLPCVDDTGVMKGWINHQAVGRSLAQAGTTP